MTNSNSHYDPCSTDECVNTLTRRDLGAMVLGTGVATMSRAALAAEDVTETDVTVKTPEGVCDAVLFHPAKGAHPGVIVWPDIGGLRPVFRDMGKRLAAEGYTVFIPNPFYRVVKADALASLPQDQRAKVREGLFADGGAEKDATAFVAFLDGNKALNKKKKMGVTGYCMGGPLTMRTAAALPERFGAGGSFHGGGLVSDQPNSPHLLVPKIKAKYIFCISEGDDQRDPEAKNKLKAAFDEAKNPADIEVYAGTKHGWCVPGSQVYDEAAAEKAWSKLLALLKTTVA